MHKLPFMRSHKGVTRVWQLYFSLIMTHMAWTAIRDKLRRPYFLSRIDHVRKVRDMKKRTVSGNILL
jgi:hypothetical protein